MANYDFNTVVERVKYWRKYGSSAITMILIHRYKEPEIAPTNVVRPGVMRMKRFKKRHSHAPIIVPEEV